MTPLEPTYPEPLRDIAAQLLALADRWNPKNAVWISSRTPFWMTRELGRIDLGDDLITWWKFSTGMLVTSDWLLVDALESDPSEEVLSRVLDYTEPKSAIEGIPVVVQARKDGCVVWEQIASVNGAAKAGERAFDYAPDVRLCSMLECLRRRRRLIEEEHASAQKAAAAPDRGAATS